MKTVRIFTVFAAGALAVNAQAGILPGYSQNFNSLTEPTAVPWVFQNGEVYSDLATTEDGDQYIRVGHLSSTGNQRWSYLYWGPEVLSTIPAENASANYELSLDFFCNNSNNQFNTEIAIVTDTLKSKFQNPNWTSFARQGYAGDSITVKAYDGVTDSVVFQPALDADGTHLYKEGYGNFVFSLSETNTSGEYYVYGNETNLFNVTSGVWYHLEVSVDRSTKVASFTMTNKADGAVLLTGKRTLSGDLLFPTGIALIHARYTNFFGFDNIKAGVHVDVDIPDAPSYILKSVNGKEREYKFSAGAGATVKYTLKDGLHGYDADEEPLKTTGVIDDIMMDGTVFDESGTLEIWAELNGYSSDVVSIPVVCEWVKLPTPVATMTGASVGFDKTYQIAVDNSEVPTKPTLGYKYAIYDETGALLKTNGNEDQDALNGTTLTLSKGTLELWAVSYGFEASDHVFFTNDTPYTLDEENDVIDFQHFTDEQLTAYGFTYTDNLESASMSGEQNWTARRRIYDYILKAGADINNPQVGDTLLFDHIIGGAEVALQQNFYIYPSLPRWDYPDYGGETTDSVQAYSIFPHIGLWWYSEVGNKVMPLRITRYVGLYGTATAVNALPIKLHSLSEDDMTLVYTITSYGTNSVHNTVFSEAEAQASNHAPVTHVIKGNGSFTINRIDESLARIEFLKAGTPEAVAEPGSEGAAIKTVDAVKVNDPNAPVYNLRGIKVNKNSLTPGIYIQNGKKFLVK